MTVTPTPEFVQSLIVLSNSRKELLATAMDNARKSLQATAQSRWQAYAPMPVERRDNVRAERLACVIDAL
jgi:hypothetical protein